MSAFQYSRLVPTDQSFRVLILEPNVWDTPIHCRVEHASLAAPPAYEALSYVWGDATALREIYLEACVHAVAINLEIALRYLRHEKVERILWVDALCINQNDLIERSEQVQKMGDIYRKAKRVVAWTGEASEDSDDALKLMEEFTNIGLMLGGAEVEADFPLQTWFNLQNWVALWRFLDRTYWSRMWILQELFATPYRSQEKCILMCGKRSLDRFYYDLACITLATVMSSMRCVDEITQEIREPLLSMMRWNRTLPGLVMFHTLTNSQYLSKPDFGLLLKTTNFFQAADDRDKIYALLGLAPAMYQNFHVDYSRPLKHVLMDLVQFLADKEGSLNILFGNRSSKSRLEPTWTPELYSNLISESWVPNDLGFWAAGRTQPMIEINRSTGVMSTRGITIGTLQTVIAGPNLLAGSPDESTSAEGLGDALGYLRLIDEINDFLAILPSESERETLWRTLVIDQDSSGIDPIHPAPNEFGAAFEAVFSRKGAEIETEEEVESTTQFIRSMAKYVTNRCFFATSNGKMGIGPRWAKPGDMAVILYGADLLFILREKGAGYELIGDAYVHGVMHGELATDENRGNSQVFDIC
ncbi:HET domain containing protein [Hyaloscypha variabilis]